MFQELGMCLLGGRYGHVRCKVERVEEGRACGWQYDEGDHRLTVRNLGVLALASFGDTLITSWWECGAVMELWACADTHR